MAASPMWKVYDASGKYQAACKEPEACACLMGLYGAGATVRVDHSWIVWREGDDGCANDSWDFAARFMHQELAERRNNLGASRRLAKTP